MMVGIDIPTDCFSGVDEHQGMRYITKIAPVHGRADGLQLATQLDQNSRLRPHYVEGVRGFVENRLD